MIVKKTVKRLEHPTEPGAWIEIRVPLSTGDLAGMRANGQVIGMSLDLMASTIVAWSYEEPVSLASVELLDLDTFTWLTSEVMAASNIRGDEEKKDSSSPSSPTTTTTPPSPVSSGT